MDQQKPELEKKLHVVLFPWLAIGHLIPFFHLSKALARKGIQISFVSTPKNLQRIPKIPRGLSSFINFVSLPLIHDENLPENAESSTDIPIEKTQYLKKAFDGLELPLTKFLENSKPDFIVHDYASYWLPKVSEKLGISCMYFAVFTASSMAFIGPPEVLMDENRILSPEDLTTSRKWIPFPSDMMYRHHEVVQYFKGAPPQEPDQDSHDHNDDKYKAVPDTRRFGVVIRDSDLVAVRSSSEFESEWLNLLNQLYKKPVIPLGFLPPLVEHQHQEEDEKNWPEIKDWLDKQRGNSVVYVALGTEAALSQEQVNELAIGLESTGLPFFWVLRKPPTGSASCSELLPFGFEDRTRGRGVVYMKWVPQVKILEHPSVGGFLTHCGYNSVIEGLAFGRVLILLPMLNDQGLIARLLAGKQVGIEIPRNELDGSFSSKSVAESVRVAMVEEEGNVFRNKAKEMTETLGNRKLNDAYVNGFVRYLEQHRI
ncbi:hypothetical protein MKW94_004920 [Papaver nudicaule]|uniref:Glycosyltransferase n=1 Tax=Papaver nudicaule TaxID=74823 RepID=A0AA41V2U8_PAPNU|nr:hypothetical protein [Papaver nudicaule]